MSDKEDLEKILERFFGKPAPPGLKETVLGEAARQAKARRILTPLMRVALAGCSLLFVLFTLADWRISEMEERRLNSFLRFTPIGAMSPQKIIDEKISEFLADLPDADPATARRLRQAFLTQERAAKATRPDIRFKEEMYEN